MHLCKENYNNCLWRKTDWALDLLKLGKASKISSDLRKSWEVFRWYLEIFGWSSEIFGSVRAIFGCTQVIFGNLWRCLGAIQKSLEVFGWSSEIFGSVRVIFGNLQKVSCGLRWSSEGLIALFHWLRQTVLFFSQIGQFLHFYSKSLLKTVQIKSQIGQFPEIKG